MKYLKNTTETNITLLGQTILPSEYYQIPEVEYSQYATDDDTLIKIGASEVVVAKLDDGTADIASISDAIIYLRGELPTEVTVQELPQNYAFAKKTLADGKKLYRRKHGIRKACPANSVTSITLTVPYVQCKIDEVEIINCSGNDEVDLRVLDSETGAYTTIPNYLLNQFGFGVCVSDLYYSDSSNYDAELNLGMQVEVLYHNNESEEKNIGVNFVLHEMV